MDPDNIGMGQRCQQTSLVLESDERAVDDLGVRLSQHLQGDQQAQTQVLCQPDLAKGTSAQLFQKAILSGERVGQPWCFIGQAGLPGKE